MGATIDAVPASASPALTRKQYMRILLAVGLGIILEWYDFVVYSQLSASLTKNFFPTGNPTTQLLAFWGVFAVGFVARPAGSILFGHIADVHGRKPCLVATVSIMGVATTIIGCLPTYHMVGVAAPVLLALLRLVQGLAMGGEFGCSLVYLHEVAPPRRKGLGGAMGFAAAIGGIGFGVLVVMIIIAACPQDSLILWGWRVPFLLAAFTAGAAVLLRLHMEEPREFVEAKRHHEAQEIEARGAALAAGKAGAAEDGAASAGAEGPAPGQGCWARALEQPFVALLRTNWGVLVLQFLFEASVSVSFWLSTSYMPGFFQKTVGMPTELSLGMLFANLFIMTPVILLSGWTCDRPGFPRVASAMVAYVGIGAMAVPMFFAFSKSWAACWLLQLTYMLLLAWVLGTVPVTMSMLYPPLQRTSGFNFAHNCAMSLLGGLAPTVVTAISATTGNTLTAPGWYMLAVTAVSIVAGVIILVKVPRVNRGPAVQGAQEDLTVEL